jgi:hypothetical protein
MKLQFIQSAARLLLFTALAASATGCGSNRSSADNGTGAIAVQLTWSGSQSGTKEQAKILSAAPAGVTTIRITVSGDGIIPAIVKTFTVTAGSGGSGTVDGIPAGSGRTVKAQGLNSAGLVTHQWEATGITILAGQTTNLGTVFMQSAVNITGKVTSGAGTGIGNIAVDLYDNAGTIAKATTTTDASGNYSLIGFPADTYKVRFTLSGPSFVWYDRASTPAAASPKTVSSGGIDMIVPLTTATPAGGPYTVLQNVTLTASPPVTIYYTTNDTNPYTSGASPITNIPIASTTTLKFYAVDSDLIREATKTETYTFP